MDIRTNNVPRDIIYGYDLTDAEREEFDWIDFDDHGEMYAFFRFKDRVYAMAEFVRCERGGDLANAGWQGVAGETFFSGTLVRYCNHGEQVVVAQYFS